MCAPKLSVTLTDDQWAEIERALDEIGSTVCHELADVIRLRGMDAR